MKHYCGYCRRNSAQNSFTGLRANKSVKEWLSSVTVVPLRKESKKSDPNKKGCPLIETFCQQ
jgi:hypothetical protein